MIGQYAYSPYGVSFSPSIPATQIYDLPLPGTDTAFDLSLVPGIPLTVESEKRTASFDFAAWLKQNQSIVFAVSAGLFAFGLLRSMRR